MIRKLIKQEINNCEKIISNTSSGIHKSGLTKWRFIKNNNLIAECTFNVKTGQIGHAIATKYDCDDCYEELIEDLRTKEVLLKVIEEVNRVQPSTPFIWEALPCRPNAWKYIGGKYYKNQNLNKELLTHLNNQDVYGVNCGLYGHYTEIN